MDINKEQDSNLPLCVDLDGTLIKTDMLMESVLGLLRKNPLYIFLIPYWLAKGIPHMKHQIAARVSFDFKIFPYHPEFLAFLYQEHLSKRKIILSTASNMKYAQQIADHLGLFSEVIASDNSSNISGSNKARILQDRFGERGFDYAGNARRDLKIWPHARQAIAVNASRRVANAVKRIASVSHSFDDRKNVLASLIEEMRIHQWLKNILIFVPLIMAHKFTSIPHIIDALLAFFSFSLCASSVYLLNDLFDLEADRHHPRKKYRPLASGDLSINTAAVSIPILLMGSLAIASILPPLFIQIIALYFLITLSYSIYLKQIVLVDVLILASLYTIRILAGGIATEVASSFWLLSFSMFLFLSLALVKRYSELHTLKGQSVVEVKGRGYWGSDLDQLANLGAASGYIAILVLALYINSQEVVALYSRPHLLWLIIPLLMYWISRIWLLAHRGQMPEDPVVFAAEDKVSYVLGLALAIIIMLAI